MPCCERIRCSPEKLGEESSDPAQRLFQNQKVVSYANQCPSRNEIVFARSRKMRILTTGIH